MNEFRLDLLEYMKTHEDIETAPKGLHAVVGRAEDAPAGVIFVLRNINDSVNVDNRNRIHPFYMVYIGSDGEIVCDYLAPKSCSTPYDCFVAVKANRVRSFAKRSMTKRTTGAIWAKSHSC